MKNGIKQKVGGLLISVFLVIITTISASAAINPQINFQGKITNPDGTNITNGSYTIRFRLYTDPTADAANACGANTCSWEETKSVTITDGIFQTALGDTTTLPGSVDFNSNNIYLGIKVGTDAEMTPRVRFTASPYAFNAEKVGGLSASQLVQLSPGSQQTGSINVSGSITTASTVAIQGANAVTLGSTSNVGAILFQDGTSNNRTVTINAAALPTASYSLTLPTSAPAVNQCLLTGASVASDLTFGSCSSVAMTVSTLDGGTANANGATINSTTLFLQSASATFAGLVNTGTQTFAGDKTFTGKLVVGSATTDTTLVLIQPDSYSVYNDSSTTCTTTVNQGAMYYNTAAGALRTCRSSGWEDMVTTAALGLQLFGVVPDTGTTPGDLARVTTTGPCAVNFTTTTSVTVQPCIAYSGGRKVIVQTATFNLSGALGTFQHICLNGTDGQPAISTAGTEVANLPTWNAAAPILCLADIKLGAANVNAGLYDLRTYTTTNKTFTTVNAAVPVGTMLVGAATQGLHAQTSANTQIISGVVVASSGVASTNTINVVYAYSGPANAKATAGSLNAKVQSTTATAGYAITGTSTTVGTIAGIAQNAWSNTCVTAATCQSSLFFILSPR